MIAMGEAVPGVTDRLRELVAVFQDANVVCEMA
jgi:hypothetical protein